MKWTKYNFCFLKGITCAVTYHNVCWEHKWIYGYYRKHQSECTSIWMPFLFHVLFQYRYMVDAADQEKLEAARNELHNLLDKPQLQGIPVSSLIWHISYVYLLYSDVTFESCCPRSKVDWVPLPPIPLPPSPWSKQPLTKLSMDHRNKFVKGALQRSLVLDKMIREFMSF